MEVRTAWLSCLSLCRHSPSFTTLENLILSWAGFPAVDSVGYDWRPRAIQEAVAIAGLEVLRTVSTV